MSEKWEASQVKVLQELVRVPLPGSCVGDGMR